VGRDSPTICRTDVSASFATLHDDKDIMTRKRARLRRRSRRWWSAGIAMFSMWAGTVPGSTGAWPTPEPTAPTQQPTAGPSQEAGPAVAPQGLAERIAADMEGGHEERPHGLPDSSGWADGPRVNMGDECPGGWNSMIPWGQIYVPVSGNPATNTRVHVKDLRTLYLSKSDGRWHVWQSSTDVKGAMYREDFAGDQSRSGPQYVRDEPGGGQSAVPGGGYNFHFWTPDRGSVDCGDIAGVVSTMKVRLVVDDPAKPDDRRSARFMASVGADYWRNDTAQWAADWSNNGDIGIGKLRFVGTAFESVYMTTMTKAQLADHPPPL
jgi:hypothetical protein